MPTLLPPLSPLEQLRVVRVADLVLHEAVEPRRAAAVVEGMARSGVLTDPVVAVAGPDGRWLVLDGAHRTTALATLAVPVAVVQQVSLDGLSPDPGAARPDPSTTARVDAWAHDVPGSGAVALLDHAAATPGGPAVVATITGAGRTVVVRSGPSLDERLAVMWALARRYGGAPYVRSQHDDPRGAVVRVSWAPVRVGDLTELAVRGLELPAGVSRFVLPGRLLGLRVPLAELRGAGEPSGAVDRGGAAALLGRLRELPIRHYREPVWVVETSQPLPMPIPMEPVSVD